MKLLSLSVVIFSIAFLNSTQIYAQSAPSNNASKTDNLRNAFHGSVIRTSKKEIKTEGSPYFMDNWSKGNILYKEKNLVENVEIKYHTYHDQIIVKQNGQELMLAAKDVKEFSILTTEGEKLFQNQLVTNEDDKFNHNSYLELHFQGTHLTLGTHWRTYIIKAPRDNTYHSVDANKKDQFALTSDLYLVYNQEAVKFSKKRFLKLFPEHKVALNKYIKLQQLDLKSLAGIKQLSMYCDQILSTTAQ
ncbi:hypothetical protein [Algivirga pacifica]|uniref:FecR protein domain-containing protein n=1 Tax=Algivirga pacifica TaxID=1162670 RepID=A0ABP9DM33_9BACT